MKDKPGKYLNTIPSDKHGVYVVCEGQYQQNNASLYLYQPLHDSVYGDLYMGANKSPLGDVFQSMVRIGDYFFLAVNNSGKVLVTSATTIQTVATIAVPFPRYILPLPGNKAYVSSLYTNKVYILNTALYTVIDSIITPFFNTEGMCLYGDYAFISTWDTASNYIYKVDINTNKIVQSIKIAGRASHNMLLDKEQMLWVLAGNQPKGAPATWTRIDPSTGNILSSFSFSASAEPIKPVLTTAKDSIYFIEANYYGSTTDNGIYRMGIHDAALPSSPFIAAQANQYYWGLDIDPVTGYVYVGDPKGFNQRGTVSVYNTNAAKVTSFNVGYGPGQFYFQD